MNTYHADIARWREKLVGRGTRLVRAIGERLYAEVADGGTFGPGTPIAAPETWQTPQPEYVGGKHRASWRAGLDTVPSHSSPGARVVGGTAEVLSAITDADMQVLAVIARLRPGLNLILVNDGPAFARLEFTGWSPQAPTGIIRPVLERFQRLVDQEVALIVSTGAEAGRG